jgi:biopolymer transport protein ExbB
MKKFTILLLMFPVLIGAQVISTGNHRKLFTATSGCSALGYAHYRVITVAAQTGLTGNLSNFPMLVSGTYSYLATVANGGLVQNASGYDVAFYTDNTCTTKLNWEVETWSATSGIVNYWVSVPTVSHTTTQTFVMVYDNASISTDQSNKTGAWDANFKSVSHLPNGSALSIADSTSNAVSWAQQNTTAISGEVDGAGSFNGNDSTSLGSEVYSPAPVMTNTGSFTMSAWINTNNHNKAGQMVVFNGSDNANNGYGISLNTETVSTGHIQVLWAAIAWWDTGFVVPNTTWEYITLTVNSAGTGATIYVNGVSYATNTFGSAPNTPTAISTIGYSTYFAGHPTGYRYFYGSIDEVRYSNSVRSADWILADYNSQSSPGTFYSVGSQF